VVECPKYLPFNVVRICDDLSPFGYPQYIAFGWTEYHLPGLAPVHYCSEVILQLLTMGI
jgi:hypothetical protein